MFVSVSTDPFALRTLGNHLVSVKIRHLPGVHAKVYVADEDYAIVTLRKSHGRWIIP